MADPGPSPVARRPSPVARRPSPVARRSSLVARRSSLVARRPSFVAWRLHRTQQRIRRAPRRRSGSRPGVSGCRIRCSAHECSTVLGRARRCSAVVGRPGGAARRGTAVRSRAPATRHSSGSAARHAVVPAHGPGCRVAGSAALLTNAWRCSTVLGGARRWSAGLAARRGAGTCSTGHSSGSAGRHAVVPAPHPGCRGAGSAALLGRSVGPPRKSQVITPPAPGTTFHAAPME